MKRLFVFLVLLSVSLAAHSAEQLVTARTVVAGRVINLDPTDQKVVAVNYCDPLSSADKVAVRLSESGEFHTEYGVTFEQNITIAYGNKFINMLVAPADSLFVEIDMAKYRKGDWSGVVFTGSSANVNNELNYVLNHVYPLIKVDLDMNLSPDEFVAEFKKSLSILTDSLYSYADKHHISPEVRHWTEVDLKYVMANYIMSYGEGRDQDRLKVFTDPIFDIYNSSNFRSMYFIYHLESVLLAMLKADEKFNKCIESGDIVNGSAVGIEILSGLPASTTRDMLIYKFLSRDIAHNHPEVCDKLPNDIFVNKVISDRLRALTEKAGRVDAAAVTPIKGVSYLDADKKVVAVAEQDMLDYFKTRYAGKVIYVDVYATWCGPCKAEFAYGEEFQKLFTGKDVVFVNLCLASTQKNWIEAVEKYKIEGENYFFDSDATQLFMSTFKLSGYPSYLLIDKSGKIVTNKAPRPSAMNVTADKIDELLK